MRAVQFKTVASYLIIVNVFLITIGKFLDRSTVKIVGSSRSTSNGSVLVDIGKNESNNSSSREENLSTSKPSLPQSFNRTKWSDVFTYPTLTDLEIPSNVRGKDFVLGIPTIARGSVSYLHETLYSLITNLGNYSSVVILVYIGEEDEDKRQTIESGIKKSYPKETSSGLIHVIYPPKDYFPDWQAQLRPSFNDEFSRVKWRSKQNLDQIYLMMYSYSLQPKYYLMLEDDIVATKDYLSTIYSDAQSKEDRNFVLISYCQLGAIGKLMRRDILPSIIKYIQLFWSDKPLDWLMFDYMRGRVCDIGKSQKECSAAVAQVEVVYKPSLFQHVGTSSSFPGKIQKLKDKNFKKTR